MQIPLDDNIYALVFDTSKVKTRVAISAAVHMVDDWPLIIHAYFFICAASVAAAWHRGHCAQCPHVDG